MCTLKGRVKVENFKSVIDLIFMHNLTQNDDIEVIFMHITIPSLHFEYPLGLGLGLGVGVGLKIGVGSKFSKTKLTTFLCRSRVRMMKST